MRKSALIFGLVPVLGLLAITSVLGCVPIDSVLESCPGVYYFAGPFTDTDAIDFDTQCTPCNLTGEEKTYTLTLAGRWERYRFDTADCECKFTSVSLPCEVTDVKVQNGYMGCATNVRFEVDSVWCWQVSWCYYGLRWSQSTYKSGDLVILPCSI